MHLLKSSLSPLDQLRHGTWRGLRWKKRKGEDLSVNGTRSDPPSADKLYVNQCNLINSLIYESKMTFFSSVVEENKSNQVTLFNAVDKMLNRKAPGKLLQYDSAVELAKKFADFLQKMETIRKGLNSPDFNPDNEQVVCPAVNELHSLCPTSVNELSTLLVNACAKSCILDPLPGSAMKACINTLLPTIVRTVNLSFAEACVPKILKQSAMEPRIKKPLLDNEQLLNYRPISNL